MALRVPASRKKDHDDLFIPFFQEPKRVAAPKHAPRLRSPKNLRLSAYRRIATAFVLLALGLFAFVLYISFARATVLIVPKTEPVTATATFTVAETPKGTTAIPGYVLETVVDGTKTVPVQAKAGATSTPGTACGTVTIVNDQGKDQPLVATTRLLTPEGVLFRIRKGVTVPAHGKTDVQACADQPGGAGDVGPTRFTIPGLNEALQTKTYAVSSAPMTGGLVTTATVADADVQAGEKALQDELTAKAVATLKGMVPPQYADSVFTAANAVKRETDAKPGTAQSSFTVSLSLHVVAVFYDPMALGQAAGAALRASVRAGEELVSVDQAGMTATLDAADPAAKTATLAVTIKGSAVASQGDEAFDKSRIVGLSARDAEQYLMSLPGVASAKVRLSPFWARTVPTLKDHVDIVVQKP